MMTFPSYWECNNIPTDFHSIIIFRGVGKNHQLDGIEWGFLMDEFAILAYLSQIYGIVWRASSSKPHGRVFFV